MTFRDIYLKKINRSCDQMELLLTTINGLVRRRERAREVHTGILLELRITAMKAAYDQFHNYTQMKIDQLSTLDAFIPAPTETNVFVVAADGSASGTRCDGVASRELKTCRGKVGEDCAGYGGCGGD